MRCQLIATFYFGTLSDQRKGEGGGDRNCGQIRCDGLIIKTAANCLTASRIIADNRQREGPRVTERGCSAQHSECHASVVSTVPCLETVEAAAV